MKRNGSNGRHNGAGRHGKNGRNGKKPTATGSGAQPLANKPQSAAPKAVDDEMLRVLALDARRDGASYRAIATTMTAQLAVQFAAGEITEARVITKDVAHKLVVDALTDLRAVNAETADHVRTLEIERLDKWTAKLSASVKADYPRTIDTLLRIAERRAKLLGLDAETSQKLRLVGAGDGPIEITAVDARTLLRDRLGKLQESMRIEAPALPAPSVLPATAKPES